MQQEEKKLFFHARMFFIQLYSTPAGLRCEMGRDVKIAYSKFSANVDDEKN
jgi:hypothetical protein